ncbi:hypothetical protein WMY93_004113 [Mugilogobius chulae]|uniref:SRCR domain-containing protein n=1 Tax=Mugilogobius chulae TaxID=88201 RepID=A0AAW0PMU4_9GOBI
MTEVVFPLTLEVGAKSDFKLSVVTAITSQTLPKPHETTALDGVRRCGPGVPLFGKGRGGETRSRFFPRHVTVKRKYRPKTTGPNNICSLTPRNEEGLTGNTMEVFGDGKQRLIWLICLLSLPLSADCDSIRLSQSKCSGRVEVLHDGRWGSVCDDHWSHANSEVLCRELGCGPVKGTKKGFSDTIGDIWLDDIKCKGNETSLLSCQHSNFGEHNCDHSEDAGVICYDPIRVSNGTSRCSGTLEVTLNGEWGVLCHDNFNPNLAKTVCDQLFCGHHLKTEASIQKHMGYTGSCPGNITSLSECSLTKSSEMCHGVALSCSGFREIKLVNGSDRCSGRVEVFFNKQWGTVCDDNWDLKDAQVVCRAVDCGAALEVVPNSFLVKVKETSAHIRLINGTTSCSGRVEFTVNDQWSSARKSTWGMNEATAVSISGSNSANEPSRVYDVSCKGTESSLRECTRTKYNGTSGVKAEDATVVCTGKTVLSDGPNRCSGRVEVYHKGRWADVCTDSWDMNEAQVVCQELNCGSPHKIISSSGRAGASVWVNQSDCNGHEADLSLCPLQFTNRTCGSSTVAGIICSEGLVVRLGNGQDRCSGRVEIRQGDKWGTVCASSWNQNKARIVCDLLECGHLANVSTGRLFPRGVGPVYDASDACFASLKSIHQCSLNGFPASGCGHDQDVGIVCGGDSSIRLINGTDRCSGRVEILHDTKWGTVCDDQWDIKDAQVVCRSKDCGTPLMAVPGAFFGQGSGRIWLDDVECLGNESSLAQCVHLGFGNGNCGHGEDAGVICSAHLRVHSGPDQCSGSVDVYYDGEWLPAVNVNWGMNEAAVVCKEMNCGDPKSVSERYSQSEFQRGFKVSCTGRESSLSQCTVRAYTKISSEKLRYATTTCSGNVKLVDGPNRCAGRVEIFHKGRWGNVCGASWDKNDAQVICQQLNCGKAFQISTDPNHFGHGMGLFMVEHIECNGRESLLDQCRVALGDKDCNSSSVASVVCSDSLNIRLVGGADHCSGRVEVRMGSGWGSVCGANWGVEKAETLCELLQCGQAVNISTVLHRGTGPVSDPAPSCFSSVQNLKDCLNSGVPRTTCAQNNDASVVCAAQIRLMGGSNSCSGRVELFYKGEWGTVCDDDWGMEEAGVVCAQLGCGISVSVSSGSSFGRGKGQIWLDNMQCKGTESVLTQCAHNGWGNHNCGHDEDAGVTCLDTLQKPKLFINPGPEVGWGEKAHFTCTLGAKQTGGTFALKKSNGTFSMEKFSINEAVVFTLPKVNLSLNGHYYCEYKRTLRLETPSIHITSTYSMTLLSKTNISISRGYSFNATCSVRSAYPGGFFYVTKSKVKVSEKKPAVQRSDQQETVFEFPYVQYLDKGEYSCVFGVNLSSQTFESTPSEVMHVAVVAGASTSVALGVVITLLVLLALGVVGYLVWRKKKWENVVGFVSRLGGALQDFGNNVTGGAAAPRGFSNINVDMDGLHMSKSCVSGSQWSPNTLLSCSVGDMSVRGPQTAAPGFADVQTAGPETAASSSTSAALELPLSDMDQDFGSAVHAPLP